MVWYNEWSDSIKKRACRYLLQRYLGQYLEEKLTLDQLTVDLYNGTGSVSDVHLDIQALNELGDEENLPIEFVDGYISEILVSIPLSQLFTQSSYIQVSGLVLTIQPKKRHTQGGSMFESMWNSCMSSSTSIQVAAELLTDSNSTQSDDNTSPSGTDNLMEGLELFASAIESVLTRVKIKFVNTTLRLEHLPKSGKNGIALEIRIANIDYCDEACSDIVPGDGQPHPHLSPTFSVKKFHCENITLYTDEFPAQNRTFSPNILLQDMNKSDIKLPGAILFGKLSSRQELRLKLKQDDTVIGPKVEIDLSLGSLTCLLSPRQLHLIIELIDSLAQPHTQDTSNVDHRNYIQKPMKMTDYDVIEQELQNTLDHNNLQHHIHKPKYNNITGWSSPCIDESLEEEFLPMKYKEDGGRIRSNRGSRCSSVSDSDVMTISNTSQTSSVFTTHSSVNSKSSSLVENCARKKSRAKQSSWSEGEENETLGFNMKLGSLSCILLHQDILVFDYETLCLTNMSHSVMENISKQFFETLSCYDSKGYGNKDFQHIKQLLSSAIRPHSHIRIIATSISMEGNEKTSEYESQSISSTNINIDIKAASFQLTECIHNPTSPTTPPQYVQLLSFMRSKGNEEEGDDKCSNEGIKPYFPISSLPDIRLHINQYNKYRNTNHSQGIKSQLKLVVVMQQCWSEVDLSIIDRIYNLIHFEVLCQTTLNNSTNKSNINPNEMSSFSQAVDSSSATDTKFDFKLSTPFLVVKFRFPIPDLRPAHDREINGKCFRNVRKDILYFHLIEPSVRSQSNNTTYQHSYQIYCNQITALFQEGGSNVPVSFARATFEEGSKPNKIGQCIGLPCLTVKVNGRDHCSEVIDASVYDDTMTSMTQSCYFERTNKTLSPFTSKHVCLEHNSSPSHHSNPSSSQVYGEELIIPAEKEDMNSFISHATSTARIQIDVSLPFVSIHLPTKHFYEVLYNRLNTDLSLWQSSSHKANYSGVGLNNHHIDNMEQYLRPPNAHTTPSSFTTCKSGLLYDSDGDSDDAETSNRNSDKANNAKFNGQSKYSLNIFLNQGLLNINTNIKDTDKDRDKKQKRGEIQIQVEGGNVFIVNYYKGTPQESYVCLMVNQAKLYHKVTEYENTEQKSVQSPIALNPSHLDATIYYQDTRAASGLTCLDLTSRDMIRAAIHIKVNENKVKIIRVCCSIENGTLRHIVCPGPESWLTQLIDFFDVIDYPVRGYDSPQVITELHQHLINCAVDYRPLNLPVKCVVTTGNFSLSSNIAARTKSSTFRFIAEDGNLFISDQIDSNNPLINLKRDYVSVIELGLFELCLRMSDGGKKPKVDLKAIINMVNIRTCWDSARALATLIKYFACDGDLNDEDKKKDVEKHSHRKHSSLSESTVERVNDMMQDAMLDERNTNNTDSEDTINECSDGIGEVFFFPDEGPVDWATPALASEQDDSEHDFCLLEHEAGSGMMPKSGLPEVRVLISEPVNVIDNYFSVSVGKADLLMPPKHYPPPVLSYTLQDMNLIWHMYGGYDFNQTQTQNLPPSLGKVNTTIDETFHDYNHCNTQKKDMKSNMKSFDRKTGSNVKKSKSTNSPSTSSKDKWFVAGGKHRNVQILMQLQLNKVKFRHEVYGEKSVQSSRQVLLIQDVEIRDRLSTSNINKFLYQYTSEALPRQSHANMVVIKAVHVRPDTRQCDVEEMCLKVSLLPLRLNIDQDSLIFLIHFFNQLSQPNSEQTNEESPGSSCHRVPVMSVENETNVQETQPSLLEMLDHQVNTNSTNDSMTASTNSTCTSVSSDNNHSTPIYIRSFMFGPEVPIRIDYEGKRVDMSQGSLQGLFMGLTQLNCLQIKLKKLSYRHGILGLDKLLSYVITEWTRDIKKNQLPNLIGGVGPMHSLVQLFQGIRDLCWLPIEQYQKDGRIVRGLQRGANSFTTCTAIAALEITARIVQAIQCVAETAFDMLSPGPSARKLHGGGARGNKKRQRQHRYNRPADIREGIANAYTLVKEGLGETAETLVRVASIEAEQKGTVGAVGGVLRQIPPTVVAPIILASAATSNLLTGVRSQLAPDARREDSNKWRTQDN